MINAAFGAAPFAASPVSDLDVSASFIGAAVLRADVNQRIYAATREMITAPNDVPANQPLLGTLRKVLRFDRSILNGGRIGQVTTGWGEMELINAEGDYDDLIDRFAVDGRRILVRSGQRGTPYAGFMPLFDGMAESWHVAEDVLSIKLRDNTYKLEVPAQPFLYGGAGGLDGTEDLKGKRKPRVLGYCTNVTPVFLIPNALVYQISSGPVQEIEAVYDHAVRLAFARNYSTSAQLLAASTGAAGSGAAIEAGRYATCTNEGLFRLGGIPNPGPITCTVSGDSAGGTYAATTAAIVRRLITTATVLKDADLALYTFDAVDAAQPAIVGYWLDGSTDATVADVIADLMGGVGGWGGMRRNGRFDLGIFTAPSGAPVTRYDRIDIAEIERRELPDGLNPPPYRFRVAWKPNYTVQTDVAGQSGVGAARVAFLSEARRLAASEPAAGQQIRLDHPLAQDTSPIEAFFRDEIDAKAEADRLLALFGGSASLYRIVLKVHPFLHEIGEVIQVTFPRWDLKAGRLLRIVAVTDDTDADQVEVMAFG